MKMNTGKKLWSAVVVAALIITSLYIPGNIIKTKAASYGLSNPTIKKNVVISGDDSPKEEGILRNPVVKATVTTWDCIYFGNYWQNDTNGDGTVDQNDEKEPIKWRVLSVDGDDAFLLADQNLDCQPYNEENADVTWESCTLRRWLNSTFLSNAFSAEEQSAIRETTVVNEDNPTYGTEGENNTTDKVYLLSMDEVTNAAYGFVKKFSSKFNSYSQTRESKNSEYAKKTGAYTVSTAAQFYKNGLWWLRTWGVGVRALYVGIDGGIYNGTRVDVFDVAVRPVIHIDLTSTCWKEAGCAIGKDQDSTTWDCIYFGNYWQNDTNDDGKINQSDEKQPIKWRVLSVDNDDIFLLADQNLDSRSYDEQETEATWETCTLRNWLNYTFLSNAFSAKEQGEIKYTTVLNEDNPTYGTEGGNDTIDKIYLLSQTEACNVSYGFSSCFSYEDETREAQNTAYSIECGANTFSETGHEGNGVWWLRTPGGSSYCATAVDFYGGGNSSGSPVSGNGSVNFLFYNGYKVYSDSIAVRPVIHINYSSSLWKSAGIVTADSECSKDIIVGEIDRSTDFWKAFSEPHKLEDGKTLTIEFENHGFGNENAWDNYYYVLHNEKDISEDIRTENYKEYAVVRGDNFGWSSAGQYVSADGIEIQREMSIDFIEEYSKWCNITKDCKVVSKFTRSGKQVRIDSTITSLSDDTQSYTYKVVVSTHKTDPVYITLSCEKAYLVIKDVKASGPVRYNANGGTGAPSSQTKYDGEPFTISSTEPTRSGYTFLGWSTDSTATIASYLSGDSYILDGVVTLYAVWKRDETPTPSPTITPTATPESTPTPTPTATPAPTHDNKGNSSGGSNSNTDVQTPEKPSLKPETTSIKVGKIIKKGSLKYKVTKISGKSGKVSVVSGTNKKLKKIVIPQSIKVNGVTFKITAIEKNAFKNYKKLSYISIKSKTITRIGKNALKGTKKKIKIMVPTSKLKKYSKMIKKAR